MIVVFAEARPTTLLDVASRRIPRGWPVESQRTPGGALLIAGAAHGRCGDWVVAGRPSAHPWGIPGHPLPLQDAAEQFAANGPTALHFAAGPFVAVHVGDGTVLAGLNGIVPVWRAQGPTRAAGTSSAVLGDLTSRPTDRVRPGSMATPSGTEAVARLGAREAINGLSMRSVDRERRDLTDAASRLADDEEIWDPEITAGTFERLWLDDLPVRWWTARSYGRWLHAPAFERPALDLAMLAGPA